MYVHIHMPRTITTPTPSQLLNIYWTPQETGLLGGRARAGSSTSGNRAVSSPNYPSEAAF